MRSEATDGHRRGLVSMARLLAAPLLAGALLALPLTTPTAAMSLVSLPQIDGSDITPAPAHPFEPTRIAVHDQTHDVYVIDEANAAVDRFDTDGRFVAQLDASSTPASAFHFTPGDDSDIAVDNSGGVNNGNVYVVDEGSQKLYAFDAGGQFLWQWSPAAAGIPAAWRSTRAAWCTSATMRTRS